MNLKRFKTSLTDTWDASRLVRTIVIVIREVEKLYFYSSLF